VFEVLTEFGKFCRKLRIDRSELLKDMAEKFDVSAAYLSAVEVGRRNVPPSWPKSLAELYSLNSKDISSMNKAIESSKLQVKISLDGFSANDRNLAVAFAREFKDLDEETKSKIRIALQNHK
jgi:transcriptional regulator with XRE-family HTH domain